MCKLPTLGFGAPLAGGILLALPTMAFASTSGTEHFKLVSTNGNSNTSSIIATGVFVAGGVDYGGKNIDLAVFPHGASVSTTPACR